MRTPTLLYCTGFLLFLIGSIVLSDDYHLPLRLYEADAAIVTETRSMLTSPTRAGAQTTETSFDPGYVNYIDVQPGVRLIHDPTVGYQVRVSGPEELVTAFTGADNDDGEITMDFDRPVATDRYLEVRMDLTAHGPRMYVDLERTAEGRTTLPPVLITEAPIEIRSLKLKVPKGPSRIEVLTEELDLDYNPDPTIVSGSTTRLYTSESDSLNVLPVNLTFSVRQVPDTDD